MTGLEALQHAAQYADNLSTTEIKFRIELTKAGVAFQAFRHPVQAQRIIGWIELDGARYPETICRDALEGLRAGFEAGNKRIAS